MVQEMRNKVAIVTGAASGIGRECAILFANNGVKVVVSDINAAGEETVGDIRNKGGEAIFIPCDVSNPNQVEELIKGCVNQYGRLDFAFNNAGTEGTQAVTHECSEENWHKVIDINLKGVWLCMKHEIPHILKNGGAIVNCSSVAGKIGLPEIPAYVASKHGVIGLTKTAALEYATQNLRINAVCPGVIQTPMIDRFIHGTDETLEMLKENEPIGRFGTPKEVAESVLWLCSEKASFVTGHALNVDGGWLAH